MLQWNSNAQRFQIHWFRKKFSRLKPAKPETWCIEMGSERLFKKQLFEIIYGGSNYSEIFDKLFEIIGWQLFETLI